MFIKPYKYLFFLLLLITIYLQSFAQDKSKKNSDQQEGFFQTAVPIHDIDIILGRPTNNSITVSVMSYDSCEGYVQYGLADTELLDKTIIYRFSNKEATNIELQNLLTDKEYAYQLVYFKQGTVTKQQSSICHFHTQRKASSNFSFVIQADSHLDENTNTSMYLRTLSNMVDDKPDFLIDLGDTWMTDKYRNNYKDAYQQYIAQRYYFGMLSKTSAIFFTLGNHDGESGEIKRNNFQNSMMNWSNGTRKKFYPNPYPNQFYAGNNYQENGISYSEDYYAWEWGNSLFVVLDPFRYTKNNRNAWDRTLGKAQYDWLKQILEKSKAKFKFVFTHNLVGGTDKKGIARGGIESAYLFEWGGNDTANQDAFAKYRTGWYKPIHALLVEHNVQAVFHGHDHFFGKQDLDGIVYQVLPQPGAMRYGNTNLASEYGYTSGKILNSPGYLRVNVSTDKVTVEFVQTSIDAKQINKQVLYRYEIR